MSALAQSFRVLSVLTLAVGVLALADAVLAGPTTAPGGQPASQPEVYSAWPFPAAEAVKRQEATAKALGQPKEMTLDLGNNVTLKLVLIPAGKFMMGSPETEKDRATDETQHEVTLSKPYYMGVYDVTQEQYEAVIGFNPSNFKGARNPVEQVGWAEASAFCAKLSEKVQQKVRLPTEAEWEYACRAGTASPFNTGETISTDQANYDGEFAYGSGVKGENRGKTTPVGSFKSNAFGLYDMHGNVWQWCADWNGPYAKGPDRDPRGPAKGFMNLRVLRGGDWHDVPDHCRSARRYGCAIGIRGFNMGLRVVVAASGVE